MIKWIAAIGFIIGINLPIAVASYFRMPVGAYMAIGYTVIVLSMVYFKIIKSTIPIYLFAVSLALMWQASMFGAHIIGSDMHGEFYASRIILGEGTWELARHYGTQSSTSIVVGAFVPMMAKYLHIDIIWIYKAILPAIFAFTPVILFFIYKRMIKPRYAFYAALFFMIVPVTSLEIVQIGKSMVAELFMALAILVIVSTTKNKVTYSQIFTITIFSLTAMLCHYTVGIALLAYLIGIMFVRFIPKLEILWLKALPVYVLPIVILIVGGTGYIYYSIADQGVIVKVMSKVVPVYAGIITDTASDTAQSIYIQDATDPDEAEDSGGYFEKQEVLVKTAIGMDFNQASTPGKAFRVIQYLTQFLIVVGGLILFWAHRHYKFTAEFIAGIWCSYLLLAMCVFVPEFSNIINITRFSLFFLAPAFVLGAIHLFKKEWILVCLMLVYFAFTSGAIYEATRSEVISAIDTPYSVGLSAERTGTVGTYLTSDVTAVRWLEGVIQGDTMVVGDYNGWHLISAYLGMERLREDKAVYNPTFDNLPDKPCYIFVTDWNTRHGEYIASIRTIRGGAGLRDSFPMPTFPYPVVFQDGNSVIYEKGEN